MPTPRPDRPVRGSQTGRPLLAAFDLLGRRWALRVLWELRDGPLGFRELQERCDAVSPSVLSARLTELRDVGLVRADDDRRNALTPLGADLSDALQPLQAWSDRWARELS